MKKFESSQRFLAIFLALFMLVGMFPMLPAVQVAAEGEEGITGGDNWEEPMPQENPNYWKFPEDAEVEDDSLGGLRLSMPIFLGVEKEQPVKLNLIWETRWGTLGSDYQWLHLKVDSRIADKVDRIEAINPDLNIRVAFEPLNDPTQPNVWRCRIIDQGSKKRGMIKPKVLEITTNRSVPIEVILKDDVPFEDIDDSDYIFQTRIIKNGKYWVNKGEHTFASYANVSTSGAGLPPASDKYNYANQSQMIVDYDPVKQVLRVFHMASHTRPKYNNSGPGYVQIIPGDIYDLLADSGTVGKLYKVDRRYNKVSDMLETYFTKDDFSQVGIEGDPGRHHVLKVVNPKYYDKTPASQTSTYRDSQWKKFVVTGDSATNTLMHNNSSEHPEGVCLELNIDPASFAHLFKKQVGADGDDEGELITYPFLGFYMWPDSDGTEYRYANTYANSTLMLGKTFYVPKIREIYTDDTEIQGSIKYNVGTVYLSLPTQNDSLFKDINVPDTTQQEYGYEFGIPSGQQLKKDMKVSVSNVDKRNPNRVFSPSDSVITRVKARVTFDLNGKTDVTGFPVDAAGQYKLDAPANPEGLFFGETGYVPNGMGETMPEDPERPAATQSKFMGWNTERNGSGETFTADTPIDESLTVYAQWEDSYKVIFVMPDGQDDIVKTYPVGTVPGAADFPILNAEENAVFAGWYVSEDENAQKIDENSAYTDLADYFITEDGETRVLKLYPHFDQKPRFQVHYYEYKPMGSDTLVHVGTKTAAEFETLDGNELHIKDYSDAVLADKPLEDAVPQTKYNTGYTLDKFKQIQDVDSDLLPIELKDPDTFKSFDSLGENEGIYKREDADAVGGLLHIMVILKPKTFEPTYYQVFDDGQGESVPKQLIEAEKKQEYNLPESYSYQDIPVALPRIEVEGYRFLGWRHTTGQDSENYPRAEITPDFFSLTHVIDYVGRKTDQRVELTAGYEKIYAILYRDSGTLETLNLPKDFTESSTDKIVLPGTQSEGAPEKTGYVFAGWKYKFSDEADFQDVPSETETVTLDLAQMNLRAHQGNLEIRGRWEPTLELLADPLAEPVSIYDKDDTGNIVEGQNGVIFSVPIPPGTTVDDETDPLTVTISYEYLDENNVPTQHTEKITVTAEHVKEGGIILALPHGEAIPSAGHDTTQLDGNEQNISVLFESGNKEKEYKTSYVAKLKYMTAAYTDLMELKYGFSPTVGNYAVPDSDPISGEKDDAVDEHLKRGYALLNSRLDSEASHGATQDELDRWVMDVEKLPEITDMPSLSEKTTANGTTVITVTPGENTNLDETDVIQVFKLEPTEEDPENKVPITEFTPEYFDGSVKLDLGNALPDGTILLVQLQDKDPTGDKLPSKLAEVVVTIDRSKANEALENTPQDLRDLPEEQIEELAQESQDIATAYNALQEALDQKDPGPSQGEIDRLTEALNDAIDKKTQADKDAAAQQAVDELVAAVKTDDYDAKKQEAEKKLETLDEGDLKDALRKVVDAAKKTQQANLNPTADNIAAAETAIEGIPEKQGPNKEALQAKLPKDLETELPESGTDESRNWKIVWNYPGDIPEGITGQLKFKNLENLDEATRESIGKFANLLENGKVISEYKTTGEETDGNLTMPLTVAFTSPPEGSADLEAYASLMKLTHNKKFTEFVVNGMDTELYRATAVYEIEASFNRLSFVLIVDQIPNTKIDVKWKTQDDTTRPEGEDAFVLTYTIDGTPYPKDLATQDHTFGYRKDQKHSIDGNFGPIAKKDLPKIPQGTGTEQPVISLKVDLKNNKDFKQIISYTPLKGGYVVLSDAPKRYNDRKNEIENSQAYKNADEASLAVLNDALSSLKEYIDEDHTENVSDTREIVSEIEKRFAKVEEAYSNLGSKYGNVITPDDPAGFPESAPEGYVTLTFTILESDQDTSGVGAEFANGLTEPIKYYIRKGTVGAGNKNIIAPQVNTNESYEFTDWNLDFPKTFVEDLMLHATFTLSDDVQTTQPEDQYLNDFVHVKFINGNSDAGTFVDQNNAPLDPQEKEFWVRKKTKDQVTLEQLNRPNGLVNPGWTFIGWATDNDEETSPIAREQMKNTVIEDLFKKHSIDGTLTLYARYQRMPNVIAADDPSVVKPDGYWTVEYVLKETDQSKGSLSTPKKWYVKPGFKPGDATMTHEDDATIQEPETNPSIGYKFSGWNTNLSQIGEFTQDVTITGTFEELGDVFVPENESDQPPPGYIAVTFVADTEQGTIANTDKFFVNATKNQTFGQILNSAVEKGLKVTPKEGWVFDTWSSKSSDVLIEDTEIMAIFKHSQAFEYVPVVETILKDRDKETYPEPDNSELAIDAAEAKTAILNLPDKFKPAEATGFEVLKQATYNNDTKTYTPAEVKVTFGDGSTETIEIPVKYAMASTTDVTLPAAKTVVGTKDNLTDAEKDDLIESIKSSNPDIFAEPTPATITVADNGETTITYPDGSKKVISGTDLVIQRTATPKATVKNIAADDETAGNGQTKVTVTADPAFTVGEVITVSYPDPNNTGETKTIVITVEAQSINTDQTIELGNEIPNGTVLTVTRQKPDEAESEAVQLTVKVDTSKVQPALNETPDNLQAKSQNEVNKIADPDDRAVAQAYLDLEKLMLKKDKTQKEIDEAVNKLKQAIDNKEAKDKTKPVTDTPEVAAVAPDDRSKDIVISNVDPKADTIEITDDDGNLLITLKKGEQGKWNISPESVDYPVEQNGTVVIKPNSKAQKDLDDKIIKATVKNSNAANDEGKTSRPVSYDAFVNVIEDPQTESPKEGYVRITFDANTGAFSDGTTEKTFDVLIDRSLGEKLPTATKAEHDFKHWSETTTGDEAIKQDTVLTANDNNKTYYAVWKLDDATYEAIQKAVDDLVNGSDESAEDYADLKTAAEDAIGKLPADDPFIEELNQVVAAADAVQAAVRDPKQENIDAANAEIEKITGNAQAENKQTLTDKVPKTSSEQTAAQEAVDDLVDKVGTEDFDVTEAEEALEELASDDPLKEELQKVIDAARATDKAVKDPTAENIEAAEDATKDIPDKQKANKDKLDKHIDKLNAQAAVDALVNGSDESAADYADLKTAAEDAIGKLPAGDPLIDELKQVVAAADAVQAAVRDPKQDNIDTANTLIADIEGAAQAENKQTLTDKVPKTSSEQTAAQEAVDDLVDKVGTEDFDVTEAEEALDKLADNDPLKNELQNVINAAKATDTAVKTPTQTNIDTAHNAIEAIPTEGVNPEAQQANEAKLTQKVPTTSSEQTAAQEAVDALVNGSDGSAEDYADLKTAAEDAIGKLSADDPLIKELNQVVAAADAVQAAVRDPKQTNIDAANAEIEKITGNAQAENKQTLTDKVPKTSSEQTAAQEAVDDLVDKVGTEDFDPTAAEDALKELAENDPLKDELQKVIDAAKATDDAVKDPTAEKIKAAEDATKDIPDKQNANKDKLDKHIDELNAQAKVNALVDKVGTEDFDATAAQTAVDNLVDGDPLKNELQQVIDAAKATDTAVKTPTQTNIDAANNTIEAIPTEGVNPDAQETNKTKLTDKVPTTSSEQTAAQNAVDDLVDEVGTEDFDATAAQTAVDNLVDGDPLKDELQQVIDAAQATDTAVKTPTQANIDAANNAIKAIPTEGVNPDAQETNKTKLTRKVPTTSSEQTAAQNVVDDLVDEVGTEDFDATAAQNAVDNLVDGDPLKDELQQVIDAAQATDTAVKTPTQANIDAANNAIEAIPTEGVNPDAQETNKTKLTGKVPTTSSEQAAAQAAVDALVNGSDGSAEDYADLKAAAETAIGQLLEDDPLIEELNKVIAAADAVQEAVRDPKQDNIDKANAEIAKITGDAQTDNKATLTGKVPTESTEDKQTAAQAAVDALVEKVGTENFDATAAEEALDKLADNDPLRDELQKVIDASKATDKAVKDPSAENIKAAEDAIKAIPTDGVNPEAQNANRNKLNEKMPSAQDIVDAYVEAVKNQQENIKDYKDAADKKVEGAPEDDPLKKVIDAADLVDKTLKNTDPNEPKDTDATYVSKAQTAIDNITDPEQQKNKQALQEALDARKRVLDIWLITCMQTFDADGATASVKPLLTTRKSYDVTLSAADAAKTRLDSDGNYYLVEVPYNFKGMRDDWELSVRARESAADECIKVQGIVEYADKLDDDLTHNVYSIESVANLVSNLDDEVYTKVVNQEDYQNLLATIERVKTASTLNAVEQVDVRVTFEKKPDGSSRSAGDPMDNFASLVEMYNATPFYLRAEDGSVQTYEGLKRQAEDIAVQFNRFLANPESYFRVVLTDNNTFDLNELTEVTYIEVEDGIEVEKVAQALEVEFDLYFRDSLMDTITLAIAIFDETGEEATDDEAISEIEQMLMDEVYNLIELYAADFPVDEQMARVEELLGKLADDNQVKIEMQAVLEAFEQVKRALEDATTLNVIAAEQSVQQLSAESQADMQSTLDYIRPKEGREEAEVKAEIANLVNNLNTEHYDAILLKVRELLEGIPEDRPTAQKVNAVIQAVEAVRSAAANVNEETVIAAANSIQNIDVELFGNLKDVLSGYLNSITGNSAADSEPTENTDATEDIEVTEDSEATETTVNIEVTEDPEATENSEPTDDSEPAEGTEAADDTESTEAAEPTENSEPTEDAESTEDSEDSEEPADTAGGAGKKRIITMVLTSNSDDKPIEVKVPFLILPREKPTPDPDPTTPKTEDEEPDDTGNMADLYDPQPPVPPIPVRNRFRLALHEKARVEAALRDANRDLPDGTDILIGDDGTATIVYPDGSRDVIPGELNVVEIEYTGIYIPPIRLPSKSTVDSETKQTVPSEEQVDAATAPGAPTVVTPIPATGEDIAVPLTLGFSLLALAVALLIYRRRH